MNHWDLNGIEAIIFDLGNVIINLDEDKTRNSLAQFSNSSYEELEKKLHSKSILTDYETGKISSKEFVKGVKSVIDSPVSSNDIEAAWNAMLLDIPDIRFDILKNVQSSYRTFCLSNTNELHISFVYDYLKNEKNLQNLDPFFEKVYLSHEMGMRKPNQEIFESVVKEQGLNPEKTLFIDDTLEHLLGAQKVGLRTFHMSKGKSLEMFL